ncbi:MAG: ABC transporter permease subunit [Candidatus Helarchaeota archaeon]
MNKKLQNILWRIQKYGTISIVSLILSIVLIILLFTPIFQIFFTESPLTLFITFQTQYVLEAIFNSFLCSFLSTILAIVLGIPLAFILANYEFPGRNVLDSLLDLPLLIPHSVAGIMLLSVFGQNGIFGQFFAIFGIYFFDTYWGITIAMFFVSSPILIKGMRDAFRKIDPNYEKAARTLGASRTRAFFDVTFLLSTQDLLSNSMLCWARGLSEFGAIYVLASVPATGATLIYYVYSGSGLNASRPIAITLILISIMIFLVLKGIEYIAKRNHDE